MALIVVSREMAVPVASAWEALSDLGSHADWMRDARTVEFIGGQTRGVGTLMEVTTRIGPIRTRDVLEVTGWEELHSITVTHLGAIRGTGVLRVERANALSRVVWEERLVFPWWMGGPLAAWLARPVLAAVMRGNLKRLESLLTSP